MMKTASKLSSACELLADRENALRSSRNQIMIVAPRLLKISTYLPGYLTLLASTKCSGVTSYGRFGAWYM